MYSDPSGLAPEKEKREAGLLWLNHEVVKERVEVLQAMEALIAMSKMWDAMNEWQNALLFNNSFDPRLRFQKGGGSGSGDGGSGSALGNANVANNSKNNSHLLKHGTITVSSGKEATEFEKLHGLEIAWEILNIDGVEFFHGIFMLKTENSIFNNDLLWSSFTNYFDAGNYLMITTQTNMYFGNEEGSVTTFSNSGFQYAGFNIPTIFIDKGDINNPNRRYLGINGNKHMFNNYSQIFFHEFGHAYYIEMMNENISTFSIDFLGLNRMTISNKISVSFENHYNQIKGFNIRSLHNYNENIFYLSPGYGYKPKRFNDLIRKYSK